MAPPAKWQACRYDFLVFTWRNQPNTITSITSWSTWWKYDDPNTPPQRPCINMKRETRQWYIGLNIKTNEMAIHRQHAYFKYISWVILFCQFCFHVLFIFCLFVCLFFHVQYTCYTNSYQRRGFMINNMYYGPTGNNFRWVLRTLNYAHFFNVH